MPGAVSIFILPPSLDALEQRLRARGQDSPMRSRSDSPPRGEEISLLEFDYVIMNEDFSRAARI